MPLTLPNLDDRRWSDLVEEGRALIPVYAPSWTDHNVHDPGITLIELFAWQAEMDIYQINRVPDTHRRKFLALVGIEPEPPKPARALLSLVLQPGSPPLPLPARLEFEGADPNGVATRFRTLHSITVAGSQIVAIHSYDGTRLHDLTARLTRGETFHPFGDDPQPGAALYLTIQPSLPPGTPISFYFVGATPNSGIDERQRIWAELQAQREACQPPTQFCPPAGQPCGDASAAPLSQATPRKVAPAHLEHHSVRTVWEFRNRHGHWQPLIPIQDIDTAVPNGSVVHDNTRSFTLDGSAVLTLPDAMQPPALGQGQAGNDVTYIRCRFVSGAYDATPELQTVLINGVEIEQTSYPDELDTPVPDDPTWYAQLLGTGNGLPYQQIHTTQQPVIASSFRLFVEEGVWRQWEPRGDFYASARDDSHFILDATAGMVLFGDGEQGRTVPEGARIWASYLATRAEAGNLPAHTINQLADSAHNRRLLAQWSSTNVSGVRNHLANITNPLPAEGGAAAETLIHAQGRALQMLRKATRAITLKDYEQLAYETPGVRLARVTAKANLHPAFPCFKAPGVITVIVVSHLPHGRPMPTPALRRMVAAYLNLRRVIGTRVEVVGPTYTRVTVQARVRPCRGVNAMALRQRIVARLQNFLDPLGGGPNGTGWPFGRDVYRSEILQAIDEVEGVDHVLALELVANDGEPHCANICLPPTGLVESGKHQIVVEGEPCRN